jgi:hypothetical protein
MGNGPMPNRHWARRVSLPQSIAVPLIDDTIAFCLREVGASKPGLKTLVIAASGTAAAAPPERVWAVLEDVASWPRWSPIHAATEWKAGDGLTVGARFDQVIELGFPVGRQTGHVTVAFAEPARRVGWTEDASGMRSCHLWRLEPAAGGGTEVADVEVFSGVPVALVKPFVARRWRRLFRGAVDGLIATAEAAERR